MLNGFTALSRCRATGKRNLFCFLSRIFKNIVSFKCSTKMKKTNISSANADYSSLEMWLNSENRFFTHHFAEPGKIVSNKKAFACIQVLISLITLLSFNFSNPLMSLVCALWFASSVILLNSLNKLEGGQSC